MRSNLTPLLWLVVASVVAELTVGAPTDERAAVGAPTDERAAVTCTFNGTLYQDGDQIPILEDVCLHCECRQGWTGPSETACARIDCPYWMLGFDPSTCPMETTPGKCCPDSPCLRKLEEEEESRLD